MQFYLHISLCVCPTTAAVAQPLSVGLYDGTPVTESSCITIDVPDKLVHGQQLQIAGTASQGSVNVLAFDMDDGVAEVVVKDCDLPDINATFELDVSRGTFAMTVLDWTDDADPQCAYLLEHSISIQDPITSINVSFPGPDVATLTELELVD